MALIIRKNKLMTQFVPLRNFFSNRLFHFFVVLAFYGFVAAPGFAAVPGAERGALVALYNDMDGPNWTGVVAGWPNGDPCDDAWTGITCNSERTSVTKVSLIGRKLAGPIPSAMGDLENLVELDLSFNLMTGEIPQELGNLLRLEVLNLQNTSATVNDGFSGGIPSSLGQLTNLKTLRLTQLDLSGSIPQEIWGLTNLELLKISNRRDNPGLITGEIPAQIGQLVNLKVLSIGRTGITGAIPVEIGLLQHLDYLSLWENKLSGNLPQELWQLSQLTSLNLWGNQLDGSIAEEIGELGKLTSIDLAENQLSGNLPNSLDNLLELRSIQLNDNELSGPLPTRWHEKHPNMTVINLSGNNFSGTIPESFGNMPILRWVGLSDNNLTGSIPDTFKDLTEMNVFIVANNQLNGPLPSWMGDWRRAVRLEIQGNQFVGEIPESFRFLTDLKTAGFSNFSWNGLWTNNSDLKDMLEQATEGDWSATQTVAPSNIKIISSDDANVALAWDGVEYQAPGRFRVWYATSSDGPWLDGGATTDKSVLSHTVEGLLSGDTYHFTVQTETDPHENNQNKVISDRSAEVVATTTGEAPAFLINAGLKDAWFNPVTDGQGFFITVFPDIGVVLVAWFTYDTALPPEDAIANLGDAGHRWLIAVGPFIDNEALLDIEIASGGLFDTPSEITRVMDGSIKLSFDDCNAGTVEYNIPSIGREGSVPIQRVAKDNIVLCEILNEELHNSQ